MTTENPINLKLKSFARFDDAMAICDLLNKESGNVYTVMTDENLGFTVKRNKENRQQEQKSTENNDSKKRECRQSLKGFVWNYLEFAIGILLAFSPYTVMEWVFALLNIQSIPEWLDLQSWGELIRLLGLFIVFLGLSFIYSYYAIKLCFDDDGVVLKKGIIAQNQVQIRFNDIKTIGVQQSILERLLGIGTLHLDSAGTNGTVDIIFNNLVNPIHMRHWIQRVIDQNTTR